MLKIIIIDRRPIFRLGLRYFLERDFKEVCLEDYNTIQESGLSLHSTKPDLIFLGTDDNQIYTQSLYEVKKLYKNSKVILCGSETDKGTGVTYLRSGAHGYLSSRSDLGMFENCIQTVLAGKFYLDPTDVESLISNLLTSGVGYTQGVRKFKGPLTARQNEIATLLAKGMPTSRIAKQLGLKPSTVSTVKHTIYSKLQVDNAFELRNAVDKLETVI